MAPIQYCEINSRPLESIYRSFLSSGPERWKALDGVKDWVLVSPNPDSYVEALTSSVMAAGDGAFGR